MAQMMADEALLSTPVVGPWTMFCASSRGPGPPGRGPVPTAPQSTARATPQAQPFQPQTHPARNQMSLPLMPQAPSFTPMPLDYQTYSLAPQGHRESYHGSDHQPPTNGYPYEQTLTRPSSYSHGNYGSESSGYERPWAPNAGYPYHSSWREQSINTNYQLTNSPSYAPFYGTVYPPISPNVSYAGQQAYPMDNMSLPTRYGNPPPAPNRANQGRRRPFNTNHRRTSQQAARHLNSRSNEYHERRTSTGANSPSVRQQAGNLYPTPPTRQSYEGGRVNDLSRGGPSYGEGASVRVLPTWRSYARPLRILPQNASLTTGRQLQELKNGLPRRILSDLGPDAQTTCDICDKTYSSKHVQPTEESEVAIVLACGHIFGEFCIFVWFDTCEKHKNKVTCPMCRKHLLEPVGCDPHLMLRAMAYEPTVNLHLGERSGDE